MNRNFILSIALLFVVISCGKENFHKDQPSFKETAFITVWNTSNTGASASNEITLPLVPDGEYSFIVDWGDGTQDAISSWDDEAKTHTYPSPGVYEVKMIGLFDTFTFKNTGDRQKIIEVSQWGTNKWKTMAEAFSGCNKLNVTAKDAPDLSHASSLNRMFQAATEFNSGIGHWDTSTITDMAYMFAGNTSFNKNIGNWNTSKVTDMSFMFVNALIFDQDIGSWNTSSVTHMNNMFSRARAFNQDISNWNISNIEFIQKMFDMADTFNQDLSGWDTSNVTDSTDFSADAVSWNPSFIPSFPP